MIRLIVFVCAVLIVLLVKVRDNGGFAVLVDRETAAEVSGLAPTCLEKLYTIPCFDWTDDQCVMLWNGMENVCVGGCNDGDYKCTGDDPSHLCSSAGFPKNVLNCQFEDLECGTKQYVIDTEVCFPEFDAQMQMTGCKCFYQDPSEDPCVLTLMKYVDSDVCVAQP